MSKNLFLRFGKQILREILQGNIRIINNIKYYQQWKSSLQPGRNSISDEQPWITFPIIDLLDKNISNSSRIFEYGGGGSTLFFVNRAKEVITVEHDEDWFRTLQQIIDNKGKTNWTGNLILPEKKNSETALDPANPLHYYTMDETFRNSTFKSYASYIDRYPDNSFDIVLVDGRSRVSCIQHCVPKVKTGGFLIVDNSDRKYYFTVPADTLKTDFKLLFNWKAPSPYADFFTQTGVWRKL